jgi:hypothetical protein
MEGHAVELRLHRGSHGVAASFGESGYGYGDGYGRGNDYGYGYGNGYGSGSGYGGFDAETA